MIKPYAHRPVKDHSVNRKPPPWLSWQGESGVQSFDLDGVGSIPTIPPTHFICFIDEFNKTSMMSSCSMVRRVACWTLGFNETSSFKGLGYRNTL